MEQEFVALANAVRRVPRPPPSGHQARTDEASIRAGIEIAKKSAEAFRKAIASAESK